MDSKLEQLKEIIQVAKINAEKDYDVNAKRTLEWVLSEIERIEKE